MPCVPYSGIDAEPVCEAWQNCSANKVRRPNRIRRPPNRLCVTPLSIHYVINDRRDLWPTTGLMASGPWVNTDQPQARAWVAIGDVSNQSVIDSNSRKAAGKFRQYPFLRHHCNPEGGRPPHKPK
ncbi:hypothetical protein AVEN_247324-1 [Araneus ventricosus]|uniref:Uncharacterized protein n=1 Tax=Araneus ventricosus TaxID=182803 RepID=A0A4Y2KD87_ARAVE|nr:hypothetical protein AVEN_247324-1 [Araneus ventricosus]